MRIGPNLTLYARRRHRRDKLGGSLGSFVRRSYHAVALRSTVFPGVTRGFLGPLLERHSGRRAGQDFGLVHNPEFLRVGRAVADFRAPAYTMIGALDRRAGDVVAALFGHLPSAVYQVAPEEAELLKLVTNAFHGLKVGFANEVGRVCARLGLDSQRLMDLVCADTRLNISPAYLRPGFAFGGSCLPKDLECLTSQARNLGVALPILEAVLPSNRLQLEEVRRQVRELGVRRIGLLGLGINPGTDDVRFSPVIELIALLREDGMHVLAHDPDVDPHRLLGGNLDYLRRRLPEAHEVLRADIQAVLDCSEVVIIGQKRPEFVAALRAFQGAGRPLVVLDLVRLDSMPLSPDSIPGHAVQTDLP